MKCPVCESENLVMSDRQGVEIDYCPKCRGVWLDRGELDKIIERSEQAMAPEQPRQAPPPPQAYPPQPGYQQPYQQPYPPHYKYKKHKSWLKELFD